MNVEEFIKGVDKLATELEAPAQEIRLYLVLEKGWGHRDGNFIVKDITVSWNQVTR